MIKKPFLYSLLVCGAMASLQARPNIVFIAIDDFRPVTTGTGAGSDITLQRLFPNASTRSVINQTLTPNMSQFGRLGVVFENAYTASPRCCPSRTAVMTGMAPQATDAYSENLHFRNSPNAALASALTIPEILKTYAGYQSIGFGKIFHAEVNLGADWPDVSRSWTQWLHVPVATKEDPSVVKQTGLRAYGTEREGKEAQPDWINGQLAKQLLLGNRINKVDYYGQNQSLKLPTGQPFFLAVGIKRPHTPWIVPQEFLDRIPEAWMGNSNFSLDEEYADGLDLPLEARSMIGLRGKDYGNVGKFYDYHPDDRAPAKQRATKEVESAIRHYLACQAFADACVGQILEGLSNGPFSRNTLVVIWSDHGLHLADKLHFGKTTLWDAANRSLLMVVDLRNPLSGPRLIAEPVSLLDIMPTIMEAVGLQSPRLEGRSLYNTLSGGAPPRNRPILSGTDTNTQRLVWDGWKFLSYPQGDTELYRFQDQTERDNLSGKQQFNSTLRNLENKLQQAKGQHGRNASFLESALNYFRSLPPVTTETPSSPALFSPSLAPQAMDPNAAIRERRQERRQERRERRKERREERRERKQARLTAQT